MIIDVSKVKEIGEDSVELVGDLAEELEEFSNPFEIGFVSLSNDANMWKNLDGCEEAGILRRLKRQSLAYPTNLVCSQSNFSRVKY